MSALEKGSPAATPDEVARSIRDRVRDWGDIGGTAGEIAGLLAAEFEQAVVSVFRVDGPMGDLVLAGASQGGCDDAPIGSRIASDRGVLDAALQQGRIQRSLHYYVEPDFVRSLPGETRSALAVPVQAAGRVLGIVHVEYASPRVPGRHDEATVSLVADYLGVAWAVGGRAASDRQDGDEAGEQRHGAGVADVGSLSSALAQNEDVAAILDRVPQMAVELLGCGGAVLLARHRSRQALEVVASRGAGAIPPGTLVPMDGTRAGIVARSGKAASQNGIATAEPMLPEGFVAVGFRDAVAVPVAVGGKTTGVLVALDSQAGRGFTASQVRMLQAIADQAGVAGAVRSIGPLRQKLSDASLIAEVGRSLTGTLGLDEVLALVVRSAEMLVSGRFAGVAILSDDRSELVLTATSGMLSGHRHAVIRAREAVPGWVALTGEGVNTSFLGGDPRGWPLGESFGPAVLVPLESRGQIRGVLIAGRGPGADDLSDDDMDTVRKLGSYAGIAIDNARLYGEQTSLSGTLRTQTEELEKAYAELRASQERLLVSEKMAALGRVTAGIAHEINSPLGSILNCLQLAITYGREYRQSALDPEVTPEDHVGIATDLLETLQLAEEATRRVGQFVRTIKGQTRMEEERIAPFDPARTVRTTLDLLEHDRADRRVRLESELATGIEMRGDPNKFAVVVQNLVSNAIDAYEGAEGVVVVRLTVEEGRVLLEVEDRGSGIREEVRPRIFDYLFTTKDIGRGTGLGLSLVHSIVTSTFRGTIDYRTEVGAGTTFVVTIPIRTAN